jgi:hypothetical protein
VEGAPDTMVGSWTLAAGASRIGYGGTWSAVKTANRWSGSWRARVSGRQGDREMAGTWRADVKAPANTTLAGMFELASAQAITGTWRSGSLAGTWSLNGADARTK